jgi:menaquinone-dependent protoporphyrinogen IX oxidase
MKPVLILYATREGHTRRIAEHLAATVRARGHEAVVVDAAHLPEGFSLDSYAAAIVSASVHTGTHEREIVAFVKFHRAELERIPAVFLSVSLSEAGVEDPAATPERRAQAAADVQRMMASVQGPCGGGSAQLHQIQFPDSLRDETHRQVAGRQHGHVARSRSHRLGSAGPHRG